MIVSFRKLSFFKDIEKLIAKQKELKSQESWILSKKGHAEKFRSKQERDQWLSSEVEKMKEQLVSLESEVEALTQLQREQQGLLTSNLADHSHKDQELQELCARYAKFLMKTENFQCNRTNKKVTVLF